MSSYIKIITNDSIVILDDRNINEKRMKPVGQYDKEGNLIAVFVSVAEAEKITKIKHIYECANNKPSRHTAGGFIWRFIKGE